MEHDFRVGMAGQDQFDINPARDSIGQRLQQLRVGDEVRIGQFDLPLGIADGGNQRQIDQAEGIVRGAADGPYDVFALCLQLRKIGFGGKRLAALLLPNIQEQFLQFPNYRALDLKVSISPGNRIPRRFAGSLDD